MPDQDDEFRNKHPIIYYAVVTVCFFFALLRYLPILGLLLLFGVIGIFLAWVLGYYVIYDMLKTFFS